MADRLLGILRHQGLELVFRPFMAGEIADRNRSQPPPGGRPLQLPLRAPRQQSGVQNRTLYERATRHRQPLVPPGRAFDPVLPLAGMPFANPFQQIRPTDGARLLSSIADEKRLFVMRITP
jgi:hypothetical protein